MRAAWSPLITPGLAAAAVALALSGCGEAGDRDHQTAGQKLAEGFTSSAAAAPAWTAQAFADTVAASDAYQLAAAKLAQSKGRSPQVRDFAAQMLQDATVTGDELRDAARHARGVTVNPQPTPAQQQNLDALRQAGDDFDKVYSRQQVAAHEQVLATLRDYADNGMDPALSEFAADAANMAADHLRLARQLS